MVATVSKKPKTLGRVGFMPRMRRWQLYVVSLTVWLTGTLWLLFHYFIKTTDQFGFEAPHPAEQWWLISHALLSFYFLWWFGSLWPGHIKVSWNARARRLSGGWLFGFICWLTLTGCVLYYVATDKLRTWTAVLHWAAGLAALVPFLVHILTRRTAAK